MVEKSTNFESVPQDAVLMLLSYLDLEENLKLVLLDRKWADKVASP